MFHFIDFTIIESKFMEISNIIVLMNYALIRDARNDAIID